MTAVRRIAGSIWTRAALTAGLLAFVLARVDWSQMATRVRDGNPWWGVAAIVCVGAAIVVGAARWRWLLKDALVTLPRSEVLRIYTVGSFVNGFLPTAVGGDVARPLMVARHNPVLVRAATSVLIERVFALVALLGLGWVGVSLEPQLISTAAVVLLAASTAAAVAGLLIVWWRPPRLRHLLQRITPATLHGHLGAAAEVVVSTGRHRTRLAAVLTSSVAFQTLVTMQLVFLGKAIGIVLPVGLAAVALALVTITLLVPVSIGGFGLREGAYVALLSGAGISHTDAVLVSLLTVPVLLIATLPGAAWLISRGFQPALDEAPAT